MTSDLTESMLYTHFGTTSPCWRLAADSDALQLSAEDGPTMFAIGLTPEQARKIRSFNGVTTHTTIDIELFGEQQRLNLIGKRIDVTAWAGTASDYSDTQSVARDLAHGLAFAEQVVSEVNSLVVVIDHNSNIKRFNRLCEEVTGLREEDVVGRNAHAFMPTNEQAVSRAHINQFFENASAYEVERTINTLKGPRNILWRNKFVQSGSGPEERYLVCSGTDVTEERRAQARLLELANVDTLTGLPNRHAIHEKIKTALRSGKRFGVLFLDLDNFKKVNDHYGHVTGDNLIQSVARLIKSCLREDDTAARLGGDEFLILLEDNSLTAVEAIAQRILDRLKNPINLGLISVYTGCSIGIALCPENGETLDDLIRSADTAMYVAKDAGKRTYRVFSSEMNSKVAQYMWLDTNLRKALDEQQLELYYQPKLCLKTGEVRGVEALVRWNSPERGRIPPLEFIPYAEESGLIVPLGKWVLQTAAAQASLWQSQGLDIRVAVNLSARQLCDSTIVKDFSDALRTAGQLQCMIDLELTESCLIEDEGLAHGVIEQFRELGAEVHLDDFGTGYSSLSQLARLPLDVIKLDRSFISSINENRTSQALVRSMVAVAQELQFKVVAEGVETEAEAQFLNTIGVDYAQGYLYGRPMPVAEFESWFSMRKEVRLVA
ncbi:MAG: Cyclic di-GMP phosphodiesterase [Herminiimonas sp.]|nr:Cyclic di-GMP phosphodiesterase [Herminiimonas sp.]